MKEAIKIYISKDTASCSVGSNEVAVALGTQAKKEDVSIDIVRTGTRGLLWLEPLVEVETSQGRVAYGPIDVSDVAQLFDDDFYKGSAKSQKHLGLTDQLDWMVNQKRCTFAKVGVIDPLSIDDYIEHEGFVGLKKAISMSSQQLVDVMKASGLRGRGGAGFPTGIKWQTVLDADPAGINPLTTTQAQNKQKYIVCNADEGDSGTFADRMLMEGDPFMLIEGMIIAGLSVGATKGFIYVRSEYPQAIDCFKEAIEVAYQRGYLGASVDGSDKQFDLYLRVAAGAYICGEETSLLESLEGKRGQVRVKPPLPAICGLFGQPTVVNNVLTLASVVSILQKGSEAYANLGYGRSKGTLLVQLGGNVKQGGLFEIEYGETLRMVIYDLGGGTQSGRKVKAVQVGGPLGSYLPESLWDVPMDYEEYAKVGAMLGHGGVVVFDDQVDMSEQAQFAMEFCAEESCGKCTPCRIGSVRGVETIEKIRNNQQKDENIILLHELCDTMIAGSLCAMGGLTPYPVKSALEYFPDDFNL